MKTKLLKILMLTFIPFALFAKGLQASDSAFVRNVFPKEAPKEKNFLERTMAAPKREAPKVEAPKADAPKAEAPKRELPWAKPAPWGAGLPEFKETHCK